MLRRTTQTPLDFVVNFPFFSEHAPETLQDFTPFEFELASVRIDTLVDGRRLVTFQVILGEVAAEADVLSNTRTKAVTKIRAFAFGTIILHTHLFEYREEYLRQNPRLLLMDG
jgi:hypothetical protein